MLNYFTDAILYPPHMGGLTLTGVATGLLLILAFELWMLLDVLEFRKVPAKSRVAWVVAMFLIHPFAALVYLLVRSRYKVVK